MPPESCLGARRFTPVWAAGEFGGVGLGPGPAAAVRPGPLDRDAGGPSHPGRGWHVQALRLRVPWRYGWFSESRPVRTGLQHCDRGGRSLHRAKWSKFPEWLLISQILTLIFV